MSQPLIRIQDLSKTYEEGGKTRRILDHVSLEIMEGEFFVLLGKSGSGKSTLLNLISAIDKADTGSITIGDTCITALNERQQTLFRRDQIGIVFQFFNLIPTLTVLENITLPRELGGVNRKTAETAARDLLERVGLGNRADAFPDKLSGGEQQRVAIARALAHTPRLVLADEPTGNLDRESGEIVLAALREIQQSSGTTVVLVTHDRELADRADRTITLVDGQIAV